MIGRLGTFFLIPPCEDNTLGYLLLEAGATGKQEYNLAVVIRHDMNEVRSNHRSHQSGTTVSSQIIYSDKTECRLNTVHRHY